MAQDHRRRQEEVALDLKLLLPRRDDPRHGAPRAARSTSGVRNIPTSATAPGGRRVSSSCSSTPPRPPSRALEHQDDCAAALSRGQAPEFEIACVTDAKGQVRKLKGGAEMRRCAAAIYPHPAGLDHDAGHRNEREDAPGRDPRPRLPVATVRPRTAPRAHRAPGHLRPRPRLPLRVDRHV